MKQLTAISTPDSPDTPWRSLHVFNIYRLIVAGVIAIIFFFTHPGATTFGLSSAKIFSFTIIPWLLVILISGFASRLRWGNFRWQVGIIILLDIGFITLLMHASGGTESGLAALMLVTIAASGILISGRMTLAFAALATLALLFMHSYGILLGSAPTIAGYTRIGLSGVGLFAVALLTHVLASRVREFEALASQRGEELADLGQINELIIQQIDIGILVISSKNKILMQNEAARRLVSSGKNLSIVSKTLAKQLKHWQKSPGIESQPFRSESSGEEILANFTQIGDKTTRLTAIFLESTAQMTHQAQQVKLASLGRLTASIAHEIRNPLGAITHAGQLLAESDDISKQDLRLTEIISDQSKRLDTIVESILSLSRKEDFTPESINIGEWLSHFMAEFIHEPNPVNSDIEINFDCHDLLIKFDPTHLEQVLCNVCNNALQHSPPGTSGKPRMTISCKPNNAGNEVEIDIIDTGPGVAQENIEKLFEPFFTTEAKGTGLGLFIARELTELNSAHLSYVDTENSTGHFRLCMPVTAAG